MSEIQFRAENLKIFAPCFERANAIRKILRSCARGEYQIALADGERRWSGSDIGGKASRYSRTYADRRRALLGRFTALIEGKAVRVEKRQVDGERHISLVITDERNMVG